MPEEEGSITDILESLKGILARRRWWVLLTACATTLAAIFVLMLLPNRYTSEATVLVIQQQVPERYVVPTSTTDVSQALQGMTQEVLSRARLLSIIDDLGLYKKEKLGLAPEELIERMRRDVAIEPIESSHERRDVNAFKISFVSDVPQLAQEVTSRLTSLFIQENEKMREHQSTVTTNFLQEHLETVRKQLTNQEELVRSFKMQHLGDLPEQEQGNVQIMASLSAQLQNTQAALSRAEEHKVYLESLLRGYRGLVSRGAAVPGSSSAGSTASPIVTAQNELNRLQSERAALLSAYTVGHPDVRRKDAEIAKAEAVLARLKAAPKPVEDQKTEVPAASSSGTEEDSAMAQVKSQLEANRVETANLSKDAEKLKASIGRYQDRLNASPVREQQLAGMVRDYELLKLNYADLLKKEQESRLAMSLEKSQEGQQFRLVDAPSLPTIPSSPKRLKISAGAAAAGIFLGFALAFFIDSTDRSFHSEKQMSEHIKLPLVVAVPVLRTSHEERLHRWKVGFEWFAGSVLVLAVLVAELYVNWRR